MESTNYMDTVNLPVERRMSVWRVSAYECTISPSGIPVKNKGKAYVTGWYGRFNEKRLQDDIKPKLNEYVKQEKAEYPFLITEHKLNRQTTATLRKSKRSKVKLDHIERERRSQATEQRDCAVVLSSTERKILS